MDVRLLGPVEVASEGRRLPLNGARPTAILAALVVHLGEVLSADRLVDLVWEEDPPATARALVASHVSGLRRALAGTEAEHLVRTRSPGYVADLPPSAVDARRFEAAFTAGREAVLAGRAEDAVDLLDAALGLWRGRGALEGLDQSFARVEALRLAELRLEAQEFRFAAELDLDRRADLVAELLAHVAAHPLRERPRGQLMTALFRTGRVAEALRCYEEGRRLLRAELGVDPGPELRALHLALLRSDTAVLGTPGGPPSGPHPAPRSTDPPPEPPAGPGGDITAVLPAPRRAIDHPPDLTAHPPAPSHLPPDVADFVGRAEQIDWATALLGEVRDPRRTAPPIGVISGRSGTGKTALAVHVAHRTAGLFPDGRLFVDLRASDSAPVRTADALARLLRALGVDPDPSPRDEEDLLGLYRTHIARRRVLLILDNAVNEALLRPLLPPGGGSAALVTSRRRLVALEGAAHLDLDVPSLAESLDLLARVAGPDRPTDEPARAAEIVTLCGRLPLAVRIAGARLAARPHWPPSRLAARLRDEHRRLDELRAGDLEVRASLRLGYAELGAQEQRALRRLALMDLPDFAAWVAAPLLGITPEEAEEAVERLVDCHFVEVVHTDETGRTRYRIHDLAREYARERGLADEDRDERHAAILRLVDRWREMARTAAARGPGGASRLLPAAGAEGPGALEDEPIAWFAAEQGCLLAAVTHCAEHGLFEAARELAAALMAASAALYNEFEAWSRSHEVALAAVRRGGDVEGEAWLLHGLGQLRLEQDRFDEAHAFFAAALRLFEERDVRLGRAQALAGMGSARREQARFDEALTLLESARALYREPEDGAATAYVLYGVGSVYRDQGRHQEAWDTLARAHRLYVAAGDRHGEALALRGLGLCHRARGDLPAAERLLRQALDLFEETGDAFGVVYAEQALAKVELRRGRTAPARARLDRCLEVTRERRDLFGEALVLRTRGEWHLAVHDEGSATEDLRGALGLWEKLELPQWRARTLRDLGTAELRRGAARTGRALCEEALRLFRALGCREADEER
ncbi:AfsR/SARP family transcriptional regulator [Streptomyces galbus]|uniref:Tetratricopeptide repeat protein n=1 Tax=Streptomyces galbus TaxID=33898 RepID=A0A4U5X221_STRGB|nr:BTAD domain-containing putative transcriptional regulator [Streptomyces galbus]TKT09045.1 tetratricopeptide repeat protein [Streptomyces galbus]GHD26078.1 SARP family transcriptional regulator [Streptomyces galbus]